ncbi:hypothetical protein HMI54_011863 [Coelomomyces lativittatus]|nr:hypothetical protein HMI54_011863 [Coelomomyces lativittatus]
MDLDVLDVRHTKPLFNIQSSHNCISALVVQDQRVYSGSTDGTLRIYDLSMSTLTEIACYKQLHQSKKLIATSLHQAPVSTLGITEILVRDSYLLTCGADGHVKWLH